MQDENFLDLSSLNFGDLKKYVSEVNNLESKLKNAQNYYQKLLAFRDFYLQREEAIIAHHRVNPNSYYESYPTDWRKVLTPIEILAWDTIRTKGNVVLYPQYPALQYFLDFANPVLKIALELDGVAFHNKERDAKRDFALKKEGWTIYRITGQEMMRSEFRELYDLEIDLEFNNQTKIFNDLYYWMLETGDGVIEAIKSKYFTNMSLQESFDSDVEDCADIGVIELHNRYEEYIRLTLDSHKV